MIFVQVTRFFMFGDQDPSQHADAASARPSRSERFGANALIELSGPKEDRRRSRKEEERNSADRFYSVCGGEYETISETASISALAPRSPLRLRKFASEKSTRARSSRES